MAAAEQRVGQASRSIFRDESARHFQVLSSAPKELTAAPLCRLGEGIGKVVYASDHWVVKRERTASEIIALIVIWRVIRKLGRMLPFGLADRLLQRPSKKIRFLRVVMQGIVLLLPKSIWFMTHIGEVWRQYRSRDLRGEKLAKEHLIGTALIPNRILFPPTRVKVGGWPGWLVVQEAVERMETTLDKRLAELARARRFGELELWLNRFLDLRQKGWQHGLFSVDAHLKNYGVTGDRVVLLDAGGLTDRWQEIESQLSFEESVREPHDKLGLAAALQSRPDIAERFNRRWKATVNRGRVKEIFREPAD